MSILAVMFFGLIILIRLFWDKASTVPKDRSRFEETPDGKTIYIPFMGDGQYGWIDRRYRTEITGGRKEFELYKLYPSENGECKYYFYDTYGRFCVVKDRNNMIKDQYRPRWMANPQMAIHSLVPTNSSRVPPLRLIREFGSEKLCMEYIARERERDEAIRRRQRVVR